jgi:micrococcal nuclease
MKGIHAMRFLSINKINTLLLLILALVTLPIPSVAGQFTVTKVYDGDTIKAQGHDIILYVLLAGIDAPEIAFKKQQEQPYAQEAKRYLEKLILNKPVDIKGYGLGPYPYNHLIGEIRLKGIIINIAMIKKGLAEVCHEMPPDGLNITPYREAEREAMAAKRGIWSLGNAYISPRQWRAMHKAKHDIR